MRLLKSSLGRADIKCKGPEVRSHRCAPRIAGPVCLQQNLLKIPNQMLVFKTQKISHEYPDFCFSGNNLDLAGMNHFPSLLQITSD